MAIADADTYLTYDAVGNREDLSDVIHMVDPIETPFFNAIGESEATAVKHEWQTDALAAATKDNKALEGDDATTEAASPTTRLDNYCQISDKTPKVSGTQRAVQTAGRADELDYQVLKSTLALRRDIESALAQNNAKNAGAENTERVLASFESWTKTNASRGSGGSLSTADGVNAPTDGAQRDFTETHLKSVLKSCWNEGGNPDYIFVGGTNKQRISSDFSGNATRYIGAGERRFEASVDVYDSDFGELAIIPSRQTRGRTALIVQSDMVKCAWLRRVGMEELAKTGDSTKMHILGEYTLEMCNEKAHGVVADLNT